MTRTGAEARPPIEDRTETFIDWIQLHSRELGIAVLVAIALVGSVVLYKRSKASQEARAEQMLFRADQDVGSGNVPLAVSDLQNLVRRYGGTTAGAQGRLMLAQLQYDQGKYADGLKTLNEASGVPKAFRASFVSLKAAGMEQQGKLDDAAKAYLEASSEATFPADRDELKAQAARTLARAGKLDDAKKIWNQLASDDTSLLSSEAKVRLGELTAKAATRS